jgi:hypothetical protein
VAFSTIRANSMLHPDFHFDSRYDLNAGPYRPDFTSEMAGTPKGRSCKQRVLTNQ